MRPSLLLALILLDFGWGATGQKRFVFCIPCYILNLELLGEKKSGQQGHAGYILGTVMD